MPAPVVIGLFGDGGGGRSGLSRTGSVLALADLWPGPCELSLDDL